MGQIETFTLTYNYILDTTLVPPFLQGFLKGGKKESFIFPVTYARQHVVFLEAPNVPLWSPDLREHDSRNLSTHRFTHRHVGPATSGLLPVQPFHTTRHTRLCSGDAL